MRLGDAMGADKPKIRWWTVVLAVFWAIAPMAMARVVPAFADMYEEMGFGSEALPLPSITSVVVGIPTALWVVMAPIVAGALVWKSRLLSRNASDLIDVTALVALLLAGMAVVLALFQPLIVLMESSKG